jgi:hypothetical protein
MGPAAGAAEALAVGFGRAFFARAVDFCAAGAGCSAADISGADIDGDGVAVIVLSLDRATGAAARAAATMDFADTASPTS